jgi:tRNA-specific 2-thiouridylase
MKPTVAVAVSGGVDSLVAAYILKKQGYPLVGLHFVTGYEAQRLNVSALAALIDVPVEVIDIGEAFEHKVIDYFVRSYLAGKTPNPCLVCNPVIKFDVLYRHAQRWHAQKIATGHYARIEKDAHGRRHLLRGLDRHKDQSYFLALLTQAHLSRAIFPLGEMNKTAVRKMAADLGLHPLTHRESQDVCFIQGRSYSEFLTQQSGIQSRPGDIVDVEGNKLGKHNGLHLYTIGQRRGINCPAAEPYYVLELDTHNNRLVVGHRSATFVGQCRAKTINWIQPRPEEPIAVRTRVRYRHQAAPSTLYPEGTREATIVFDRPQASITPGQGAVFYVGDEIIGGGFISGPGNRF